MKSFPNPFEQKLETKSKNETLVLSESGMEKQRGSFGSESRIIVAI
jgi:hypothetical protein